MAAMTCSTSHGPTRCFCVEARPHHWGWPQFDSGVLARAVDWLVAATVANVVGDQQSAGQFLGSSWYAPGMNLAGR